MAFCWEILEILRMGYEELSCLPSAWEIGFVRGGCSLRNPCDRCRVTFLGPRRLYRLLGWDRNRGQLEETLGWGWSGLEVGHWAWADCGHVGLRERRARGRLLQ